MITAAAVIHGDRERLLGYDPSEHPVALQLGGSDPKELACAAEIGAAMGYDEINLNCGCPSDRVKEGRFGACLMAEPDVVARCFVAMRRSVEIPVTIKCRIGIDDQDAEVALANFVDFVAAAGCRTLIVHARKAWLNGLSPKENRELPPLDYERVYRLKASHPELQIVVNGGIGSLDEAERHLQYVDGVMLGRAAYQTPYMLAEADQRLFGEKGRGPSRAEVIRRFADYAACKLTKGVRLSSMTRHILGLYHAEPGGRLFRRMLSEQAVRPGAGIEVIEKAMAMVERGPGLADDPFESRELVPADG
jgi:tRNA-dihydrouridine synthase A